MESSCHNDFLSDMSGQLIRKDELMITMERAEPKRTLFIIKKSIMTLLMICYERLAASYVLDLSLRRMNNSGKTYCICLTYWDIQI
jgi:hypothetical protein